MIKAGFGGDTPAEAHTNLPRPSNFPLLAGEFTLKSAPQSLADWQDGGFYDNGGSAPGADDTVILPANMTVEIDDSSVAFVGSFARIIPQEFGGDSPRLPFGAILVIPNLTRISSESLANL